MKLCHAAISHIRFQKLSPFGVMVPPSIGLEVFYQSTLFSRRQIRAINVPAVSISRKTGVEPGELTASPRSQFGHKSDFLRIVNVVSTIENLRPILDGLQEMLQCGNRAIVQIRSAGPDAVEGQGDIASGLAKEVVESPAVLVKLAIEFAGRLLGP